MPADLPPLEERHRAQAERLRAEAGWEVGTGTSINVHLWHALARQIQRNEALQARLAQYEQRDPLTRPLVMHTPDTFGRDPGIGERERADNLEIEP
jgi:hypothetical protein